MKPLMLLRYDTESTDPSMDGFLPKAAAVHRADEIPVSFFCTGKMLEFREEEYGNLGRELAADPLFEFHDHSYSHIGVGYEAGRSLEELRADYEKSFALHLKVLGKRPEAVSICGVSDSGARLKGFDTTPKAMQELAMLAGMGVRMINSFLSGHRESTDFTNYSPLGFPALMGFPSAYSDTSWLCGKKFGEPLPYLKREMERHIADGAHMAIIFHDWAEWNNAPDKELGLVRRIAEYARALGFELTNPGRCYARPEIWNGSEAR